MESVVIKNPDGQVIIEGQTLEGKRTGLWKFYARDGSLVEETNYLNGLLHGPSMTYGLRKSEVEYQHGKKHGKFIQYHPDGWKSWEIIYIDGKAEGLSQSWHSPNQLMTSGYYKNGQKVGFWYQWNYKGELEYEEEHDGDKKVLSIRQWNENENGKYSFFSSLDYSDIDE